MKDYTEPYEVIDQEKKIVAVQFSKLDRDTQMEILKGLKPEWGLSNVEMRWDLETGHTILNKENWTYTVMEVLLPQIIRMTDDELDEAELNYKRKIYEKNNDSLQRATKHIFDNERQRRQLFAKREAEEQRRQRALRTIEMLGHQSLDSFITSVDKVLIDELQNTWFSQSQYMMYSALYGYGFIQGKRAERTRRKLQQNSKENQKGGLCHEC